MSTTRASWITIFLCESYNADPRDPLPPGILRKAHSRCARPLKTAKPPPKEAALRSYTVGPRPQLFLRILVGFQVARAPEILKLSVVDCFS